MSITIESRHAITDVIHLFYHLVDSGHASQTARLFAPQAKLTFGPGSPQPGTITGDRIRVAMTEREALKAAFTRHVVSNIMFGDGAEAPTIRYLLTLFRSDDETRSSIPAFVADVIEIWQHGDDCWQIAERTIMPTFARA